MLGRTRQNGGSSNLVLTTASPLQKRSNGLDGEPKTTERGYLRIVRVSRSRRAWICADGLHHRSAAGPRGETYEFYNDFRADTAISEIRFERSARQETCQPDGWVGGTTDRFVTAVLPYPKVLCGSTRGAEGSPFSKSLILVIWLLLFSRTMAKFVGRRTGDGAHLEVLREFEAELSFSRQFFVPAGINLRACTTGSAHDGSHGSAFAAAQERS